MISVRQTLTYDTYQNIISYLIQTIKVTIFSLRWLFWTRQILYCKDSRMVSSKAHDWDGPPGISLNVSNLTEWKSWDILHNLKELQRNFSLLPYMILDINCYLTIFYCIYIPISKSFFGGYRKTYITLCIWFHSFSF